jgi:transcriptional regulator with GAF, ATPase, and Fis domain
MDIDRFIMRAAATLLAGAAVVLPIAGAVIWVHQLPAGISGALVIGCLLLAALLSLLMFSHFRSYLEQEVESSLFPARYAGRQGIRQLSAELVQLPLHTDGGQRFTQTLMEGLGLDGIALYLRKRSGVYKLACSRGEITSPALLHRQGFAGAGATPSLAQTGWETCVPVRADGADLGFIVLGRKRSGAAIDDADTALLVLVASQLAVGLKNAEYVRAIDRQQREIDELRQRLEAENIVLRSEVRSASQSGEIIGSSVALQRVLALVEKVAPTDASILITGETGTGKELIARAVHDLSPRRNGPLISVNCPAIPPELAESELFGHERGAFTGATEARPGKFELANGGTIFLDEIADLPMRVQVKLLRVLQEREVQRLGGHTVRQLDLRVVAATNHNLETAMRAGRFREDLYYRLAAVRIALPPLRERTEDIPILASFFLERAARTHQRAIKGFTAEAVAALSSYSWPGNIRELQNVIERAVLLCTGGVIRPEYLSELAAAQGLGPGRRAEKLRRIEQALAQAGGNHAAAARLLGVSPSTLARMIKSLSAKLPPPVH